MGSRLSSVDEMRLTHAIEKAATLASVSDADRSGILSEQLIKADVDPKFAKVASAAFNKRLTVLTLEKTADEHKADPFPLADAAVVCELMGGDAEGGVFRKSASYDPSTGAFEISFEAYSAPVMRKAASMPRHVNMEERLDYRQLQEKVGILMDKNAAAYQELSHKMSTLDSMLNKQAAELSSMLCSAEGSDFLLDRLNEIHGPGFSAELMSRMPADMPKRAHAADPMDIYRKAGEFSDHAAMYGEYEEFMGSYGSGLEELSKAAAAMGNHCAKAEVYGLTKTAISPGFLMGAGEVAPGIVTAAANEWAGSVNAGINSARNLYGTAAGIGSNLMSMYDATRKADGDASKLLDADFIMNDRKRDRLLAWTDMAADPAFSMYPSEQLFHSVNTLMDTDAELEKPYRREMLRAQLGQTLAQNGRQSTADIAATASTLKAFNDARKSAIESGADTRALSKSVSGPASLDLHGTLGGVSITPLDMSDAAKAVGDTLGTTLKGFAASIQAKRDKEAKANEWKERKKLLEDPEYQQYLQLEEQVKADAQWKTQEQLLNDPQYLDYMRLRNTFEGELAQERQLAMDRFKTSPEYQELMRLQSELAEDIKWQTQEQLLKNPRYVEVMKIKNKFEGELAQDRLLGLELFRATPTFQAAINANYEADTVRLQGRTLSNAMFSLSPEMRDLTRQQLIFQYDCDALKEELKAVSDSKWDAERKQKALTEVNRTIGKAEAIHSDAAKVSQDTYSNAIINAGIKAEEDAKAVNSNNPSSKIDVAAAGKAAMKKAERDVIQTVVECMQRFGTTSDGELRADRMATMSGATVIGGLRTLEGAGYTSITIPSGKGDRTYTIASLLEAAKNACGDRFKQYANVKALQEDISVSELLNRPTGADIATAGIGMRGLIKRDKDKKK